MGDNNIRDCCSPSNELERRVNNIEQTLKDYGGKISEVETKAVLYNEQIKTISNILQEIKISLRELQKAVDELEKRPADTTQKIIIGVLTSLITTLIMLGMKFLQ